MGNAEYDKSFWGGKIVDGHWRPNLAQLEDEYRKGLNTYRDQGPTAPIESLTTRFWETSLPREARLALLQRTFFAPGNKPP